MCTPNGRGNSAHVDSYARVVVAPENLTYDKANTGASISVYHRPEERELVQPAHILPLSRTMREMLVNQRLEKLVWQWSDQLCGDLTQYILKDTLRLLSLRDINEEFLKNIYVNKVRERRRLISSNSCISRRQPFSRV